MGAPDVLALGSELTVVARSGATRSVDVPLGLPAAASGACARGDA